MKTMIPIEIDETEVQDSVQELSPYDPSESPMDASLHTSFCKTVQAFHDSLESDYPCASTIPDDEDYAEFCDHLVNYFSGLAKEARNG